MSIGEGFVLEYRTIVGPNIFAMLDAGILQSGHAATL
jgi:hypothetical protein